MQQPQVHEQPAGSVVSMVQHDRAHQRRARYGHHVAAGVHQPPRFSNRCIIYSTGMLATL